MKGNEQSHPNANSQMCPYRGYKGLPPLVGLLAMEDAVNKGLTVHESVQRLKRVRWALKRLHQIFIARIAAMPVYELKMAFSLHAHYCAEHIGAIDERIKEMRQPPYGLRTSPNDMIDLFFDEILNAPQIESLVVGLYEHGVPAIVKALTQLIADTNKLFDHPTYRICRFALLEMQDLWQYGEKAIASLVKNDKRKELEAWSSVLKNLLDAAGNLDGTTTPSGKTVERFYSREPYKYDGNVRRDERFKDLYNMGVHAEAMLFNPNIEPLPKTVMLYFMRLREIDVPEVMSSIIAETDGKPWKYYRDMTRQLWDEARHAMMGEIGFASLQIDWTQIPVNFTWSVELNTKFTPRERHADLYAIEQGLMGKKNGKQSEWQIALKTSSRLAALIQDYDWADEILHARIGREWFVPEIGSPSEALAYGDKLRSLMLIDWAKWRDKGLTEHRNWWPEIYKAACKHWGVEPNPDLLAYQVTYEDMREDLKSITG